MGFIALLSLKLPSTLFTAEGVKCTQFVENEHNFLPFVEWLTLGFGFLADFQFFRWLGGGGHRFVDLRLRGRWRENLSLLVVVFTDGSSFIYNLVYPLLVEHHYFFKVLL
jgi:hypothetical protein